MLRSERQIRRDTLRAVALETADGIFTAHYSEHGLAQLDFPQLARGAHTVAPPTADRALELTPWIDLTRTALRAVLNGEMPPTIPPLDLRSGTEFQQRVWRMLCEIPVGTTKSYGEMAAALGATGLSRAVGAACGANPIPVIIPCHRVLAGQGKLGGFSGGLVWKKRLLAVECASAPLLR